MTPERWGQVERLYFAALERTTEERTLFLAGVCGEDAELRHEVETLLQQQAAASSLLEAPVKQGADNLFATQSAGSLVGQTLGAYQVVKRLGAGGMGEVYQAQDTRLARLVALKILPLDVAHEQERLQRFVREAKAASALNHPHVATIYEIGAAQGIHFIAMEYVAGQSLAAKINEHPLALNEIIAIGSQMADALAEAHSKGIVHRDIKPANVMLTTRGQVKVLDFGLAKLTHAPAPADSNADTLQQTRPGVVMGTVPYMSPEQALGRDIDHRSDIFSLGVVLYEMATGKLPFVGANTVETLDRILHAEPEAITQGNADAPAELERILRRCLEKDREQRFASANDLLIALEALQPSFATPNQEVTQRLATATRPALPRAARWSQKYWLFVMLPLLLVVTVWRWQPWRRATHKHKPIAVLPLKNLSGNAEMEWFSDGITESLITEFQRLKSLQVIASTSVMQLKDTKKSVAEIARDLGVEAVLEGSALRIGEQVRVTARLIEPTTARVLWTEEYDRAYRDVLTLYRDIARTVAREIQVTLTPDEQVTLAQSHTVVPAAQDALLKARFHLNQVWQDATNIAKALASFEEAARLDPRSAEARAGIAESFALLGNWGQMPQAEAFPKARDAALQALALDENSAAAHRAMVFWHFTWQHDWPLAEREIKRTLELAPNDTRALSFYSEWLIALSRFDEAIAMAQRAHDLAPLDLSLYLTLGRTYYFARRYDDAIRIFKAILDINANWPPAAGHLSHVYYAQQQYDEAWQWKLKVINADPMHTPEDRQKFVTAWQTGGWPAVWREELAWVARTPISLAVKAGAQAVLYGQLNEKDQAFAALDTAFQEHSSWLFQLNHPGFDAIRSDARFKDLLQRLNLPPT